jgi:mRNA-degrading endonuclease RelE of RelBE toxin-antitoxin system
MQFTLEFTESAIEDLGYFTKYEVATILDQVEVQLGYQPAMVTRNRKPLEANALSDWELRIGAYRVFYDVDAANATVKVKAVGRKEHNRLFIRGREYVL